MLCIVPNWAITIRPVPVLRQLLMCPLPHHDAANTMAAPLSSPADSTHCCSTQDPAPVWAGCNHGAKPPVVMAAWRHMLHSHIPTLHAQDSRGKRTGLVWKRFVGGDHAYMHLLHTRHMPSQHQCRAARNMRRWGCVHTAATATSSNSHIHSAPARAAERQLPDAAGVPQTHVHTLHSAQLTAHQMQPRYDQCGIWTATAVHHHRYPRTMYAYGCMGP
jgi:hypothetical protein